MAIEVAIKAFKQYFISILTVVATHFPKSQQERFLLHVEQTLNLLRQANTTPKVSDLSYIFGPLNYNKIPLGPMGCAVIIHKKSGVCAT